MARSYKRRGARGRGLLTREAAVQSVMQSNSLYCLTATTRVDGSETTDHAASLIWKKSEGVLTLNNDESGNCVRVASIFVSSQSPFEVDIKNAVEGWISYQIPANKIVKIVCPRDNSIIGNAALLKAWSRFHSQATIPGPTTPVVLARVKYAESPVDVKINVVCDSTLDD